MVTKKSWVAFASFLTLTLIGNGAIWKCAQYSLEKQRIQLEEKKRDIERMSEAIRLREKLTEQFYRITAAAGRYQEALRAKAEGKERIGSFTISQQLIILNTELDQVIGNFNAIESQLAQIGEREARTLDLNFRPPNTPSGIRLE